MVPTSPKTYSELCQFESYNERLKYLLLNNHPFDETFGRERYLNQSFYASDEWKRVRDYVILRDNGCDLGVFGMDIYGRKIIVHHMNPIAADDIIEHQLWILDPEFLITTTQETHNAIHYGDKRVAMDDPIERKKNDTCPWKE